MEQFVTDWGYLGVFLGIIATGLGFPMPEELPVVVGGILTARDDVVVWKMLPVCILGVVLGDSCLYWIGRLWGRKLVERPFFQKHFLTPERMASIEENFHNYGIKILLFARLTPGIRAPIFVCAGITRLSLPRFLIADGLYAIPGVAILFFLGYFAGDRAISIIKEEGETVKTVLIITGIVAIGGYFTYRFLRKPMVTGSPAEVPKIMEPVSRGVDQVTGILIHPESHVATNEPIETATNHQPTEEPAPQETTSPPAT